MRTTAIVLLIVCGVATLFILGCDDNPVICQPKPVPSTVALRAMQCNELSCDLYHHLRATEGNFLVAPHSITTCFGMAYAGARGGTEREIANVLHFEYPPVNFHSALHDLNALLESRGSSVGTDAFRLAIANSAWGRQDYTYLPDYLDTLSVHYQAELQYVDFAGQPEAARLLINQWAFDHTYGLIKDLIPPGDIDPLTVLVLVNTIYFRAGWLHQFDPAYTYSQEFHRLDGSTVSVPVMNGEANFPFFDGSGYKALAMPYKGEECEMLVLLPDEGLFQGFESTLTTARVAGIADSLRTVHTLVNFPKFAFESAYELKTVLQEMGMRGAFWPGADFSGIDGTKDGIPWISFVAHKTFIAVDEWGTLAAAGTGIGLTVGCPPTFDALRPFVFIIRDIETGTVLFMGRVVDPSIG